MDRLKRSLDELETPICANCDMEMRWTRSALEAGDMIHHLFFCPCCQRTGESRSKVRTPVVKSDKLLAPRHAA